MKTSILTSAIGLALLFLLNGCEFFSATGSSKAVGVNATGIAYEIVVVAKPDIWNDSVGTVIKNELIAEVPGLPQDEPSMRVMQVAPDDFNGMLTYVRNILVVDVNESQYTKVSVRTENDRWANGQAVVYLSAPARDSLSTYLQQHHGMLVKYYTQVEMERLAKYYKKTYSSRVYEKLKDKFGIGLNVPEDFSSYKDTTDFFWATNDTRVGQTYIAVYTFPYTDKYTFTGDYLIAKRDSVMRLYVPGSFPGSYMRTTEYVTYTPVSLQGKYCGVLRGLWDTYGDNMGGPFVSYARLDEANRRVIVTEGFVYAPETDKRSYIRRIEAALHTLQLSEEAAGTALDESQAALQ
ncbi:MAG: DUF4837 family protein [Tannerella sp.]|jgi:hypothetical protein|nr:DUF4837 family protein [Tannerella sp.]